MWEENRFVSVNIIGITLSVVCLSIHPSVHPTIMLCFCWCHCKTLVLLSDLKLVHPFLKWIIIKEIFLNLHCFWVCPKNLKWQWTYNEANFPCIQYCTLYVSICYEDCWSPKLLTSVLAWYHTYILLQFFTTSNDFVDSDVDNGSSIMDDSSSHLHDSFLINTEDSISSMDIDISALEKVGLSKFFTRWNIAMDFYCYNLKPFSYFTRLKTAITQQPFLKTVGASTLLFT